jgi:uncharacterized protein
LTYTFEDNIEIRTKDNVSLNALVVKRRVIKEKQPVILVFNIYNDEYDKIIAKISAANGYIGIVVNLRGKNHSNDSIIPFEKDGDDAFSAIDWISKQDWCNGKVAMYGGSYLGFSQWAATKKLHPALKTIVPQASLCPGIDFVMVNNIQFSTTLQWLHFVSNSQITDKADYYNDEHWSSVYANWYKLGLPFNKLDSLEGRPNKYFQNYLSHPNYDNYWRSLVPNSKQYSKMNIPILSMSGYYDGDLIGTLHYFNEYNKFNKNSQHYLLIGPYNHQGIQSIPRSNLFGYEIDKCALMNFGNVVFDWFDFVMKEKKMPTIIKDKINIQEAGSNKWKHVPNFNKLNNDTLTFYISNELKDGGYLMKLIKPKQLNFISHTIDFKDRSDTIEDVRDYIDTVLDLKHSICLESSNLEDEIILNGSIFGNLQTILNKKDFDFKMCLYEKFSNGKYLLLNDHYIFRASYLKDRSKRILLKPNYKESLKFNTGSFTSRKLAKGSKIVITLGIEKSSMAQINYGTGKDVSTESIKDAGEPLQIKWYNDSYIKIPVWRPSLNKVDVEKK